MGALNKVLPITYVTMLIASLSLAGFPFLSGFYSKDYLLESSYSIFGQYAYLIYFISILSTTISSYYSFRLIFFVFFGDQAASNKTIAKISESSYFLYTPLIILAIFSIFSGYYLKDLMTLQTSFYNFNVSIFNNISPDQEFFNDLFKTLPTTFSILGLILVYSVYVLKVKNGHIIYRKYILFSYLYCKKFFADAFNNLYVYLPSAKFSLNITYKLIDQGFLEQFGSTGIYNFLETIFKNLVNLETTLLIYRLLLFFIFSLGISIALFLNMSIIFIILFLIMSLVICNHFSNDNQRLTWILSFDSSAYNIPKRSKNKKSKFVYNYSFLWMIVGFQNPQTQSLTLATYSTLFVIGVIVTISREYISSWFTRLLNTPLGVNILFKYTKFLFYIKTQFDNPGPFLCLAMALPGLTISLDLFFNGFHIMTTVIASACWFTIGLTLIIFDENSLLISKFIKENIHHDFSKKVVFEISDQFLEKGFWTKLGSLTATGQAAIYAGAFGTVSVVANGMFNVYLQTNQLKNASAEAEKNRQQTSAEAERNRQQTSAEAERNRQHTSTEAEKTRQHERDRWAHEQQNKNRTSSWWSKK